MNGTTYTNETGNTITTTIENQDIPMYIYASAKDYFNNTYAAMSLSYDLTLEMKQSDIKFRAYELFTGDELPANITIDTTTKEQNQSFYLKAGSYVVDANSTTYYNTTKSINVTALQNETIPIGLYNVNLTIIPRTAIGNNSVANATFILQSPSYAMSESEYTISNKSTASYGIIPGNYTYTVSAQGKATTTGNITINTTGATTIYAYLYDYNSVLFTFKDEITKNTITGTNISLDIINEEYSDHYTTTNGTLYPSLLQPLSYVAYATATGYHDRSFYFTVTDDSSQQISIYLLNISLGDNITINVINTATNPVEGAIVKVLKLDTTTNNYENVETAKTNFEGKTKTTLFKYTTWYKFIIEYSGEVVKIIPPTTITSSEITFQINTGGTATENFDTYQSLTASWTDDDNGTIGLTYSNEKGTDVQICVTIYEEQRIGYKAISEECDTGSSGYIISSVTLENNTYYQAQAEWKGEVFSTYDFKGDTTPYDYPLGVQAIFTLILVIVFAFVAPELCVLAGGVTLLAGGFINLHPFSMSMSFAIIIVGLIIAWMVNR